MVVDGALSLNLVASLGRMFFSLRSMDFTIPVFLWKKMHFQLKIVFKFLIHISCVR